MTTIEVKALKRAIGALRPMSDDVRARAQSYTRARRRDGASQQTIARELGISQITVSRWLRGRDEARVVDLAASANSPAALMPVQIVDRRDVPTPGGSLVVTTPSGLRIEGLDIDALCNLVGRLG